MKQKPIEKDLLKEKKQLEDSLTVINRTLNNITKPQRLKEASKLIGKCFREQNPSNPQYKHFLYIYSVTETLEYLTLDVIYYEANNTYFAIENTCLFQPTKNYIEISHQEFIKAYHFIQSKLKDIL